MERGTPKSPGETLLGGKLEVLRILGAGGMGTVYEVRHRLTKHRRALKVMHPFEADATMVKRFLQEASVAGTLDSEYIVETFDAGQLEDGSFYVLMEMLEGDPLRTFLWRRGTLDVGTAFAAARELCRGLQVAHAQGIIHRDLKPDNVFLATSGEDVKVKLLDFGISKFQDGESLTGATESGAILGTPLYMSPEQLKSSKNVDPRTDIYAVGVMLYEMLVGERPFEADSLPSLLVKIYTGEFIPLAERDPSLPAEVVAVVERAMHLDADRRFASAAELGEALAPFATSIAMSVAKVEDPKPSMDEIAFLPTAASDVPPPPAKKAKGMRLAGVLVVLAGVLAAAGAWVALRPEQRVVSEPPADEPVQPEASPEPPIPVGEVVPLVEPPVEMREKTTMRRIRPSERDGLMRPSYGRMR
ncbi:MAG: serine/threonine-protein kinase [Myxococcota bacterium]